MGQALRQADARQPREIKLRRQQNLSVKLRQGISKRTGSAPSFLISVSAKFGSANIGDGIERDPKTRDNSLTGPLPPTGNIFNPLRSALLGRPTPYLKGNLPPPPIRNFVPTALFSNISPSLSPFPEDQFTSDIVQLAE